MLRFGVFLKIAAGKRKRGESERAESEEREREGGGGKSPTQNPGTRGAAGPPLGEGPTAAPLPAAARRPARPARRQTWLSPGGPGAPPPELEVGFNFCSLSPPQSPRGPAGGFSPRQRIPVAGGEGSPARPGPTMTSKEEAKPSSGEERRRSPLDHLPPPANSNKPLTPLQHRGHPQQALGAEELHPLRNGPPPLRRREAPPGRAAPLRPGAALPNLAPLRPGRTGQQDLQGAGSQRAAGGRR